MATPSKQGFPWLDGQFFNDHVSFAGSDFDVPRGPINAHIIMAHDERDGEVRIRLRRVGVKHAETNEVEIGLSKEGTLTTFDRYDS